MPWIICPLMKFSSPIWVYPEKIYADKCIQIPGNSDYSVQYIDMDCLKKIGIFWKQCPSVTGCTYQIWSKKK